jgi:hypothetical protein
MLGLPFRQTNKRQLMEPSLAEGVERISYLQVGTGDAGQKIAEFAEEIGAHLVVVGHRPQGPLARWWFGSVGSYLVKRLRWSVLVAQTEISDDEFELLKQPGEMPTADPAPVLPSE